MRAAGERSGKGPTAHYKVKNGAKPLNLNVEHMMPPSQRQQESDESLKPFSVAGSQRQPIRLQVNDRYNRMQSQTDGQQHMDYKAFSEDPYPYWGNNYPFNCGQWFNTGYGSEQFPYQAGGSYQGQESMQNIDPYQACNINLGESWYNCSCFDPVANMCEGSNVENYPVSYDRLPSLPPLITWKKKKAEKYGTLLVQRGKSQMVVKIPVNDQNSHEQFGGGSQFYNFAIIIILLMSTLWAYVY